MVVSEKSLEKKTTKAATEQRGPWGGTKCAEGLRDASESDWTVRRRRWGRGALRFGQ